jgi:hypothetical protein
MKLFAAPRSKRKFNNRVSFNEKTQHVWMWQVGSERIVGHSENGRDGNSAQAIRHSWCEILFETMVHMFSHFA